MNKFSESISQLLDQLQEQEWYIKVKSKWDEVDPVIQKNIKLGILVGTVVLLMGALFTSYTQMNLLRKDLELKRSLLQYAKQSADELSTLQGITPGKVQTTAEPTNWTTYFQNLAQNQGFEPQVVQITQEKDGESTDLTQEKLMNLELKKITVRQLVRFAFHTAYAGSKPVRVRNVSVNTHEDLSGYLDVTFAVSAFDFK